MIFAMAIRPDEPRMQDACFLSGSIRSLQRYVCNDFGQDADECKASTQIFTQVGRFKSVIPFGSQVRIPELWAKPRDLHREITVHQR
ncbi:hypothetical protein BN2475_630027 [Paraburkholderia ribeironis]|uniref:Uncharacterized protein n=1 Tax=Paraburkholderia ribeironis TaxID=1247936 RepID=A0A1N7SFK9_9BURK|nr:hypothetical protein BN2475_630027 [Paraburkholderia ribeironis]